MKDIKKQAVAARQASYITANLSTEDKNRALAKIADKLQQYKEDILLENKKDIANGEKKGLGPMIDRLTLTEERIDEICDGIQTTIGLDDFVGDIIDERTRPNGLVIKRIRVPLGVVCEIYESRPNVTVDAFTLCLKSGNAVVLKGGSDAINSNRILVKVIKEALTEVGISEDAIQFIDSTDRESVNELLKMKEYVDVVIPRGGKGLINHVVQNSYIPVIETGASVVHMYIDSTFNLEKALNIIENAKTRRVSICNALDVLLVHKDSIEELLPHLAERLTKHKIQIKACPKTYPLLEKADYSYLEPATDKDWDTEFLDYKIAIKAVDDMYDALVHIREHSLKHTEVIITEIQSNADKFLREVDSACVFHNASSQFSDGGEFGLGAEIGISTQKLHVRGPFALEGLTTFKWIAQGDGQIRPYAPHRPYLPGKS
jgi:glutamate-5-semialdehyde dehydrogenase